MRAKELAREREESECQGGERERGREERERDSKSRGREERAEKAEKEGGHVLSNHVTMPRARHVTCLSHVYHMSTVGRERQRRGRGKEVTRISVM